jgi:DNA mismatch repair protein MutL
MSIQILPARLANQIAAGEVVERPASVVKELVENSLDAGATRILIDIERGGHKLIKIRDNGAGIIKDELALALSRHATSKIATLEDLEQIASLGFRGEALASISSVSRLTLTSKPKSQAEAWQAYAEGRDMAVQLKPAAHPDGTSIEVRDLFFNTPARRKFLRTEKTEFQHIDELVKRIALSRFDVAITLQHNGKVVRQYRPVFDVNDYVKRIAQVAGKAFLSDALFIESGDTGLKLTAWTLPLGHTSEPQYTYVNGRMMRDKLILHAIRQAYDEMAPGAAIPAFVIYLDIDHRQVDVNVHPAKHEVRFHQGRLVHDFIIQAIKQVIAAGNSSFCQQQLAEPEEAVQFAQESAQSWQASHYDLAPPSAEKHSYSYEPSSSRTSGSAKVNYGERVSAQQQYAVNQFYQGVKEQNIDFGRQTDLSDSASHQSGLATAEAAKIVEIMPINNGIAMIKQPNSDVALVSLKPILHEYWQAQISEEGQLASKALLLPVRVNLSAEQISSLSNHLSWLSVLGFEIVAKANFIMVKKLPLVLYSVDVNMLLDSIIANLDEQFTELMDYLGWFASFSSLIILNDAISAELAQLVQQKPELLKRVQSKAVKIDLSEQIQQLEQG